MPEDFLQLTVSFFFSAGCCVSGSLAGDMAGLTSRPCCCCCCLFVAKKAAAAVCWPADPTRPGNLHERDFQVIWTDIQESFWGVSRGYWCCTVLPRRSHLPRICNYPLLTPMLWPILIQGCSFEEQFLGQRFKYSQTQEATGGDPMCHSLWLTYSQYHLY